MRFVVALVAAHRGLARWASRPRNERWRHQTEGTPVPVDLTVAIAEEIAAETSESEPPKPKRRRAFDWIMLALIGAIVAALAGAAILAFYTGALP